jgi:hypothetical protein
MNTLPRGQDFSSLFAVHGPTPALLTGVRPKIKTQRPQTNSSLGKEEVPMKSLRNRALTIAAVALAAVFASAVPASAQVAYRGSFTLHHQMRWQNSVLPAGDYTFELKSIATPRITLKGPHGYQFITAAVADEKVIGQSMLVVENRGNESCVRELRLAPLGRSLRYSAPKARKEAELARGPITREEIAIAANVK